MVEPLSLRFRVITAKLMGVAIFRYFTVNLLAYLSLLTQNCKKIRFLHNG